MNAAPAIIFYDGECALCHGFVKYVVTRDKVGEFRFAPLQGETVKKLIPTSVRSELPDSVVVRAFAGELFLRSDGVIYVLQRLGAGAKILASLISLFPRSIRDFGYSFISRIRKKVFGTKSDYCPIVPSELKERFLL